MQKNNPPYHKSVLVQECLEGLNIQDNKCYLDATLGGGGHARAILESNKTCRIVAFDWDKTAINHNAKTLKKDFGDRITIIWGNFAHCYLLFKKNKISHVDGVLADFGTSQYQIHNKDGFSFSLDTTLDMRMSKSHYYFNAEYVVNKFTPKNLMRIFSSLGEEPHAKKIAFAIADQRKSAPITTTKQLSDLISRTIKHQNRYALHPATRVFQALRIFVNKELENIELFLKNILPLITPHGRLACISFHSLEDRIVKTFFNKNKKSLSILTKKPISPSEKELEINHAARSAKLRIAEKGLTK